MLLCCTTISQMRLIFFLALISVSLGFSQGTKSPIATADFSSSLPPGTVVRAIKLKGESVYIAFGGGTSGLLRGGPNGAVLSSATLPPGPIASWVFDAFGSLLALRPGRGQQASELEIYGDKGFISRLTLESSVSAATSVGGALFLIKSDGSITPAASSRESQFKAVRIAALPARFFVTTLDNRTVVIVDKHSPAAKIVDVSSGEVRSVTLESPKIAKLAKRNEGIINNSPNAQSGSLAQPLLFSDATGDGKGNLFVGLASFTAGEGAPLMVFNRDGQFVRSIHLSLLSLQGHKTGMNPEGRILPRWLSIDGAALAASSLDGVVSIFSLD